MRREDAERFIAERELCQQFVRLRKHRRRERRSLFRRVSSAPAALREGRGRSARRARRADTLVYSRRGYSLQKAPISSRPNIGWRRLGMDVVSRLMESTTCLSAFVLERA